MSRRLRICVALLGIAGAACVGPTSELEPAHGEAIRDSVEAMLADYSRLVEAGDLDSLVLLYADDPDFVWIESGRVAYRSRDDIRTAFEGLRSMNAEVQTVFEDPVITPLAPGLAALAVTLDQTFAMPDGSSFGFGGAISATLIHTDAGWIFLNGHTSSLDEDAGG